VEYYNEIATSSLYIEHNFLDESCNAVYAKGIRINGPYYLINGHHYCVLDGSICGAGVWTLAMKSKGNSILMNVTAIHANMERPVSMISIDFNATACQGTTECVVKMISMNVLAIHANMEQPVPTMSIDFNATACQGIVECVVKMISMNVTAIHVNMEQLV